MAESGNTCNDSCEEEITTQDTISRDRCAIQTPPLLYTSYSTHLTKMPLNHATLSYTRLSTSCSLLTKRGHEQILRLTATVWRHHLHSYQDRHHKTCSHHVNISSSGFLFYFVYLPSVLFHLVPSCASHPFDHPHLVPTYLPALAVLCQSNVFIYCPCPSSLVLSHIVFVTPWVRCGLSSCCSHGF